MLRLGVGVKRGISQSAGIAIDECIRRLLVELAAVAERL